MKRKKGGRERERQTKFTSMIIKYYNLQHYRIWYQILAEY